MGDFHLKVHISGFLLKIGKLVTLVSIFQPGKVQLQLTVAEPSDSEGVHRPESHSATNPVTLPVVFHHYFF